MTIPTRAEFVAAPAAAVAGVAPATLVYAAAGTRRAAALAGLGSTGDEYARWSLAEMWRACGLLFGDGVQHIFTLLAAPGQFAEVGRYRERLLEWIAWGLGSDEALAGYAARGWRVRLVSDLDVPVLAEVAARLDALTPGSGAPGGMAPGDRAPVLWCLVIADVAALWGRLLESVVASGARTQAAAIRAFYGEEVPPATFYLSFGKPVIAPDLLPPLLMGKVDCYWTQRPGYALTQAEWRAMLYDAVYVRRTWQADKTHRAEAVAETRAAWEHGPTLGLGVRLGPFWYPQPWTPPPGVEEETWRYEP